MSTVYLDCNATTPMEPAVAEVVRRFMEKDYGNPASPLHDFGTFARMAVEKARGEVAEVVAARRDEVIFTSGATEANNLAILGLAAHGLATGRCHVIGTRIEHKAVLEPLEELAARGFEVDLLPVGADGRVRMDDLRAVLRPDTFLVTVMHVNNETGIVQPLTEITAALDGHPAILHTDAAQGFGKEINPLRQPSHQPDQHQRPQDLRPERCRGSGGAQKGRLFAAPQAAHVWWRPGTGAAPGNPACTVDCRTGYGSTTCWPQSCGTN